VEFDVPLVAAWSRISICIGRKTASNPTIEKTYNTVDADRADPSFQIEVVEIVTHLIFEQKCHLPPRRVFLHRSKR
jgi:hypothetical protein